ncbi:uncharacterized protein LOC108207364 [Daucus carota subsp. sativus]|uniref:uncharacterized protein LOC108207364 n=1 Tax=Daucus carota subsp. sativus TaxID=79200 RepID=UPI0007EFA9ED|nr:PREDICTED: uncharacterized protein LOC108207364 [Daucus carota subsp. sativus]
MNECDALQTMNFKGSLSRYLLKLRVQLKYPRLYRLSSWKNHSIQDTLRAWEIYHTLDFQWVRELRSWEKDQIREVEVLVQSISLNSSEDQVIWKVNGEAYNTKSSIEIMSAGDPRFIGNWNQIWKIKVPHKIQTFLWKLEAGALPTNESINLRLGDEFSKECPRCRGVTESVNHIFWNSLEAKSIWCMVANWWSLNATQKSKVGNSLKETLSIFKGIMVSAAWKASVAAVLWSLWLRRNNLIFNHYWETINSSAAMIKYRSFKWLRAEMNFTEELYNLWQVNPMGATMLHNKNGTYQDLVWWNAEFKAFTDGSWKFNGSIHSAGIGGYIEDTNQSLIFIFSGPSKAASPKEAEREAIIFAYKSFISQRSIQGRLQIITDCLTLVDEFQKCRAGNSTIEDHADWIGLIKNPYIKIVYSPRENLTSAHELAAQGVNSEYSLHAWC